MEALLKEIRSCNICESYLPLGPRPVLRAMGSSKIIIIGQAPGTKVHASGIPWDDQSGKLLREWMDIDADTFYDESKIAIIPMGFCYPGKGKSGDLPPRPECAENWHDKLLKELPNVELIVLIGQYAQKHYLGQAAKKNLTETVRNYAEYLPKFLPLPHPSPRNRLWLKKNPWFDEDIVPVFREQVIRLLS